MRVTQGITDRLYHKHNNSMLASMLKNETRIMTQDQFTRASQDSINASKAMIVRRQLLDLQIFNNNLSLSKEIFNAAETGLYTVAHDNYLNVNTKLVQAANETYASEDLAIIAEELEQTGESVIKSLNATFAERNIFGGTNNSDTPFTVLKDSLAMPSLETNGELVKEFSGDTMLKQANFTPPLTADANSSPETFSFDINYTDPQNSSNILTKTFSFGSEATFNEIAKTVTESDIGINMSFNKETSQFSYDFKQTPDPALNGNLKLANGAIVNGKLQYNMPVSEAFVPAPTTIELDGTSYSINPNDTVADMLAKLNANAKASVSFNENNGTLVSSWKENCEPVVTVVGNKSLGDIINNSPVDANTNITPGTALEDIAFSTPLTENSNGKYSITINGVDLEFDKTATVEELCDTVSRVSEEKNTGVKLTFDETTNSFKFDVATATKLGNISDFKIADPAGTVNLDTPLNQINFAKTLSEDANGDFSLNISGTNYKFKKTDTVSDVLKKFADANEGKDTNSTLAFDDTTGQFVLEPNEKENLGIPPTLEIDTSASVPTKETALKDITFTPPQTPVGGKYTVKINGEDFIFDEDATVNDIIRNVNSDKEAGVILSFDETNGQFNFKLKDSAGVTISNQDGSNLAESLMNTATKNIVCYNDIPVNNLENPKDFPGSDPIFVDIGLGIRYDENFEVDPQTAMDISLNGAEITGCGLTTNADGEIRSLNFAQQIFDAAAGIATGDNSCANEYIDIIQTSRNKILTEITTLGANQNSIDFYLEKNEDYEFSLLERQNQVEGCDMNEEITNWEATNAAYEAILQMSASILPKSIFDFI